MELPLADREGTGRPGAAGAGASIPPVVVGPTGPPVAFSLLIETADADRLKMDEMKFGFFFSVSGAGVSGAGVLGAGVPGAGVPGAGVGGSACATAVLAMTGARAAGGFWEASSSASSSERSVKPWLSPLRTVPTPAV